MNNQVEEVKGKTDIVSVIGERVELKKAGRNFKANCPFHGERTPSFMVSPELQVYKCFGCFPAGQFVKTPFGYHEIQDVVDNEYVVSGRGNVRKVLTTHKRNYKGKLITVKQSMLTEPVSLTEDHMVYVVGGTKLYLNRYKYLSKRLNSYKKYSREKRLKKIWNYFSIKEIRAGDLKKGMSLLYPIDSLVSDIKILDLSRYFTKKPVKHGTKPFIPNLNIKVDNNFLKFVGYYIAEGSGHRAYVRFSISDKEISFAKDIVRISKEIFGLEAKICRKHKGNKTGTEISICNSVLANVFENLCGKGAENKHIPFVFQQLPKEKQMVLLNAIYRGDGHKTKLNNKAKTVRKNITTISRTLSEQITDILLRIGYYPSRYVLAERVDKNGVHHKKSFVVAWCVKPNISKFHHIYEDRGGNLFWILPIMKISPHDFSGYVYNLTVDQDHSYIANSFAVSNCGKSGDVFSFLEDFEGMEFSESLKYLAEKTGVKLKEYSGKSSGDKQKLIDINIQTQKFYSYSLLSHQIGKKALEYLLGERGLKRKTVEEFGLGFSPENSYLLKSFLVEKKKFNPSDIQLAGIANVRGSNFYDRFSGRVIFPLHDHRGNVIGFAGRVLPWGKKDTAKYINSPDTPIYHKSQVLYGLNLTKSFIKRKKVAIIVEGELDAISSYQAGIKNVVAIKGSALTEAQVRLLSRFAQKFILALDADLAGDSAARRGITIAANLGVEVKIARLTKFKDPDEAARKDLEGYKKALIKSVNIWDFFVESTFEKYNPNTSEGNLKISKELIPILAGIENKILQSKYVGIVARRLGVGEDAVIDEVKKIEKGEKTDNIQTKSTTSEANKTTRRQILEEKLISLIFRFDPKKLKDKKYENLFSDIYIKRLRKFVLENKIFDVSKISKKIPAEMRDKFNLMVMSWGNGADEKLVKTELEMVEKQLVITTKKEKLLELQKLIAKEEEEGDEKKLEKLKNQFREVASILSSFEEE